MHKSAWPFMEPVDPTEAPDYYKVIKEPMGKHNDFVCRQRRNNRLLFCRSSEDRKQNSPADLQ